MGLKWFVSKKWQINEQKNLKIPQNTSRYFKILQNTSKILHNTSKYFIILHGQYHCVFAATFAHKAACFTFFDVASMTVRRKGLMKTCLFSIKAHRGYSIHNIFDFIAIITSMLHLVLKCRLIKLTHWQWHNTNNK